jgi:hypothetical protein
MYNVEAIQQQMKAIATAHAEAAKTFFEQGRNYLEQLTQVKSPDKAIELNSEYAKTAYESFMAETKKISDLYKGFTKEAFPGFGTSKAA